MKKSATLILALFCIASCSESGEMLQSRTVQFDLGASMSYEYKVGQDLDLVFEWQGSLPAVFFSGLNMYYRLEAKLENQKLEVSIPSKLSSKAGTYHIKTLHQNILEQLAEIRLLSRTSDGKIVAYLGPKSILNDGQQKSQITAFPTDSLRNPTGKKSSIDLNVIDDAVESGELLTLTEDFITRKFTSDKGTSLIVGVESENAFSEVNQIRTLSLCPTNITLYKADKSFLADGHQFFKVWTDFLIDKNGQQIADGTIARLRVLDEDRKELAEYKSYAVNGIVSCWIQNPSIAGSYFMEITICNVSQELSLGKFSNLVSTFRYKWKEDEIVVGPVTNSLGQYVPDGSSVSISIEGETLEQTIEKHIVDGYARFALDEFWLKELPSEGLLELNNKFYKIQELSI